MREMLVETKERLCGSERLSSQAHLVFQHIQPVHSALGFPTEPKKASPSQAIVDNHKRRTNLLQDNSWIRRESDEDHCVYPGTNKEIPSYIKSPNKSNSHFTERNQSCPSSPGSSVNDLAKRFGGSQEVISKESPTLTTKSKTVSFGKIITSELGKEANSNWQNTFLPTTKASAEPSSNISSFSARVFHSSRLPHNNPSPVIHHKASPITHTGKEVVETYGSLVHPTSNGTTESTIQTKTNNPSNLDEVESPAPVSLTPPQANIPPPIRCVTEKGLCSYCCEPVPEAGARIILEDLQICSHTTCFKCEVCCCPLGDLEEGVSCGSSDRRCSVTAASTRPETSGFARRQVSSNTQLSNTTQPLS